MMKKKFPDTVVIMVISVINVITIITKITVITLITCLYYAQKCVFVSLLGKNNRNNSNNYTIRRGVFNA